MWGKWLARAVVILVTAGSLVPVSTQVDAVEISACADRDTAVTHPYPISGFWIFQRRDSCEIRATVEAIHRQGGDTLLTFGPRLTQRSISADGEVLTSDGAADPVFLGCVVDDQTCYRDAAGDVAAVHPDSRIVATYAYSSLERYGTALLRCGLDRELVQTADRIYYRLLVPDASPGSCPGSATRDYRLVLIAGASADWLSTLLAEADAYGVSVYPGLPTSPTRPAPETWRPDLTQLSMLTELTRRVLTDYANRHAGHGSLRGVYQSFEAPLKLTTFVDILTLYEAQHAVVQQVLPDHQIAVSPYWDARRGNPNGTPPTDIKGGFKSVARTGVDIIIPQDSRGTGKVGLFWPYQSSKPVDPRVAVPSTGISPGTTYGDAYFGSTMDFYAAAHAARQELASEGVGVELWANLEAFEPTAPGADSCGSTRTLTDKARLDHALTFAQRYASKIISFMWDGYYTCRPSGGQSLQEQITDDFDRPIAAYAFRWRSSRLPGQPAQDGIAVHGYHLAGSTIHLTWYDSGWTARSRDLVVSDVGWYDPTAGASSDLPDPMQSVWVPFAWTDMAPDFWVHIAITNESGKRTTHRYSLGY